MRPSRVIACICLLSAAVQAQWLKYVAPGTPVTRDGKPDLAAKAPRAADGKPDLSGVWMHEITTPAEMVRLYGKPIEEAIKTDVPGMEIGTQHKYAFNIFIELKAEELMRPATVERMRQKPFRDPTDLVCGIPAGIPWSWLLSEPIKIVQSPKLTVVLSESEGSHRQIYTDGRSFPKEFANPAWLGYSIGHWEGDTLVVETAGFNDRAPLDGYGHPHSERLRVVERFRRVNFGTLNVDWTFEDPEMYTRPFTIRVPFHLLPTDDIFENFCGENEKDRVHLVKW
jgi:hypothetical protein